MLFRSMFDKVINGHAKPGMRFIEGIAKAFKMSPSEVMLHTRKNQTDDPWVEENTHKLNLIPVGMRGVAGKFIDSMIEGEAPKTRNPIKPKVKPVKP